MPTNMIVSKFKCTFKFTCTNKKQPTSSFVNETDVSKEYLKAFRTKSYMEICDKLESHIAIGFDNNESHSSSSSIRDHYIHHCDVLPEPEKVTMANLPNICDFDTNCLLLDFFNAGLEAWKICEKLLHFVYQENINRHNISGIIKLAERVPKTGQRTRIYKELALYSSLENRLSDFSTEMFPKIHNHLKMLLKRLTTNQARLKRKRTLIMCMKKVLVCDLKRVCPLLDVAAKGIYTLIKDFDTIGSLAGKLQSEVEFGRTMARKCVESLKTDVLEEVLREFRVHESRFMEQLEELKDHIYLCLLNVDRSRRLMMKETVPLVAKVFKDL